MFTWDSDAFAGIELELLRQPRIPEPVCRIVSEAGITLTVTKFVDCHRRIPVEYIVDPHRYDRPVKQNASPVGNSVVGGLGRSFFSGTAVFAARDLFRIFEITWNRVVLHRNESGEIIAGLEIKGPCLRNVVRGNAIP